MSSSGKATRPRHPGRRQRQPLLEAAPVFAALGDETRLEVVARLCAQGPLSIARITDGTGVTRQAVSKHLRVLEQAGLVHGQRSGREIVWRLEPQHLGTALESLAAISRRWDEALGRLQALVEEP